MKKHIQIDGTIVIIIVIVVVIVIIILIAGDDGTFVAVNYVRFPATLRSSTWPYFEGSVLSS